METDKKPTKSQVIRELAQVAFAPAGDGTGAQLKYSNKLKALELLCKLLGLVTDKKAEKDEQTDMGATGVVLIPVVETTPQSPQSGDSPPYTGGPLDGQEDGA